MKIKIKQLFDEITKQKVYPLTTILAVKDPKSKKSLSDLLLTGDDEEKEVASVIPRDADTFGVITQLKRFLTGQQIFPKTKTSAVYDEKGNRLDTVLDGLLKTNNTVVSTNADYADIGKWVDGNPDNENRIGKFVEIDTETSGQTIKIATPSSNVTGVVVEAPAFSANASTDKYDSSGNLLPQYAYICLIGLAVVCDNGSCGVNGRCMPDDNGDATPSSNNMGYQVIERVDTTHIIIAVAPNSDMVQRIRTDVTNLEENALLINERLDTKFQEIDTNLSNLNNGVTTLKGTTLTGTLSAGNTQLVISNASIKTDSTIDIYTNVYGVSPKSVVVTNGQITLEFKAQETDINVKVVIK